MKRVFDLGDSALLGDFFLFNAMMIAFAKLSGSGISDLLAVHLAARVFEGPESLSSSSSLVSSLGIRALTFVVFGRT